jgi:hypothetical protein
MPRDGANFLSPHVVQPRFARDGLERVCMTVAASDSQPPPRRFAGWSLWVANGFVKPWAPEPFDQLSRMVIPSSLAGCWRSLRGSSRIGRVRDARRWCRQPSWTIRAR